MAGDWIKMRTDLFTHPKVVRITSALKADRLRTVGGLMSVWCLFDAHSVDGQLEGYDCATVDEMIGWQGFAEAMKAVGWLEESPDGLALPEFETHNGQSAKRRAQDADRKRADRSSASDADKKRTREEKRREEKKVKTEEVPSSLSEAEIAFEFPLNDGSVYQLSLTQVAEFQELYPAANVDGELRACLGWNRANPRRRKTRSGILKHINTWLADKQNSPRQSATVSTPQKFDPVAHVNRNRFAGVK